MSKNVASWIHDLPGADGRARDSEGAKAPTRTPDVSFHVHTLRAGC
jgi:hypothetical protein